MLMNISVVDGKVVVGDRVVPYGPTMGVEEVAWRFTGVRIPLVDKKKNINTGVRSLPPTLPQDDILLEAGDVVKITIITEDDIRNQVEARRQALIKAGDILGVSVGKFRNMLNGAMYRAYVVPIRDLINRFAYNDDSRNKNHEIVKHLVNRAQFIRGFEADNCRNTSAFGLVFDGPKESKDALGKPLWKRLRGNSRTRNDLIVKVLSKAWPLWDGWEVKPHHIRTVSEIPSTVLRKTSSCASIVQSVLSVSTLTGMDDLMKRIVLGYKGQLKNFHLAWPASLPGLISDTHRMCQRLGQTFNPRWSFRRIKQEHDEMALEITKRESSPEPIEAMEKYPQTLNYKGVVATLFKSCRDIAVRGLQHHHCVAVYAKRVEKDDYVVYSLEGKGLSSTLGISTNPAHRHIEALFSQHYHAWNQTVKDEDFIKLAGMVIKAVNKVVDQTAPLKPTVPAPEPWGWEHL
jgi:hypothetical protein